MKQTAPRHAWYPAWLKEVLGSIRRPDQKEIRQKVRDKLARLTNLRGSLGRLENAAIQVAEIRGKELPQIKKKTIYIFAADHGAGREDISPDLRRSANQMLGELARGQTAVNILAVHTGASIQCVNIGMVQDPEPPEGIIHRKILSGTRDMTKGPAMSRQEALLAMEEGCALARAASDGGVDCLGVGAIGSGQMAPAYAVAAVMTGKPLRVIGRGEMKGLPKQVRMVELAIRTNKPDPSDPLDVLSKVGGLEMAAISGFVLGAAISRIPVVVDGFVATTGALVASRLGTGVKDFVMISSSTAEKAHKAICSDEGWEPLLDLDLRLGQGTGACLGIGLVEAAILLLSGAPGPASMKGKPMDE